MSNEIEFLVAPDGTIHFIYSDAVMKFFEGMIDPASLHTQRASNVEKTPDEQSWQADLSPVGGPVLPPTRYREDSLKSEVDWLSEHLREIAEGKSCPI